MTHSHFYIQTLHDTLQILYTRGTKGERREERDAAQCGMSKQAREREREIDFILTLHFHTRVYSIFFRVPGDDGDGRKSRERWRRAFVFTRTYSWLVHLTDGTGGTPFGLLRAHRTGFCFFDEGPKKTTTGFLLPLYDGVAARVLGFLGELFFLAE